MENGGAWLRDRINFSQRTANLYMKIAKEFGSNSQAISNLETTKLGLLLEIPEEKRANFIEEHNVKEMSTRQLKEVIKKSSDKTVIGSCIDYALDPEEVEIEVDCLKPLPNHEKYFFRRTGKDWIQFLNSVDKYGIYEPIIIATKLDKIKRSQLQKQVKAIKTGLNMKSDGIVIPFSAETKQGREEIWNLIDSWLETEQ